MVYFDVPVYPDDRFRGMQLGQALSLFNSIGFHNLGAHFKIIASWAQIHPHSCLFFAEKNVRKKLKSILLSLKRNISTINTLGL
jgi:hypothetical protein